ncbi:MAG: Maf-like protein [Hoeflea sp.]|uniref:Maf-like protein n=1 Tax=Hoeflea sp. TaxID=1940281 RepID=UPI001D2638B8|nr:Maf-like protein [Hoeflea sp.]MBU4531780.1 Maf-like protein [Alphaproteobacteria bacterium]MBU4544636.1 Maf-like protein [Alphaproteobacteria bacterium]MBU4552867.1 Maf-like protein [Alphaproteobacteria bacterium]MBV1725056.1 Maf-like protein [Hoeflea sp.]MBV1761076.1 Maf-like protein [Hoeflea sp.]
MAPRLVLASASPYRKALLANAGLSFDVEPALVDERAIEQTLQGLDAEDTALILAEAKAQDVSSRNPGALVIGSDQTLSLDGDVFHKPEDMEQARRRLLDLSGRTHELNSAVVLARDGETIWRHVSIARMTMRQLDPGFIGRHLSHVGDRALSSVGAYQFEGQGIQLFDRFEGDYFTIIGLPLMPLLSQLRDLGAIDG